MKIAIIYDTKFPYTTGFYCERALKTLGHEVEHISKNETKKDFDFYLNVDDDVPYFLHDSMRPNVYWVSDTHRPNIQWRFDKCKKADLLFVSQQDAFLKFKQERDKVYWLCHACDPVYHNVPMKEKKFDIGFVGNVTSKFHQKRKTMLETLSNSFSNVSFVSGLYLSEMARHYADSKIVFNCSLNDDINMRLFEGMCSGSMVLTDSIPYLFDVVNYDSVSSYDSVKDLVEKVNFYLQNEEQREKIAKNGLEETKSKHTYEIRMKQLVDIVKESL